MRNRNNEKNPTNPTTNWTTIFGKGVIVSGSFKQSRNVYYLNSKVNAAELEKMYERLKNGPLIVYRDGGHYSVVYAYQGNKDTIELKGFQVQEVCKYPYNDENQRVDLKTWTKYESTKAVYYYLK